MDKFRIKSLKVRQKERSEPESILIDNQQFINNQPPEFAATDIKKIKRRAKEVEVARKEGRFTRIAKADYTVYPGDAYKIVAEYLKAKHRKMYGGFAINTLLLPEHPIYAKDALPDYDFFSP